MPLLHFPLNYTHVYSLGYYAYQLLKISFLRSSVSKRLTSMQVIMVSAVLCPDKDIDLESQLQLMVETDYCQPTCYDAIFYFK